MKNKLLVFALKKLEKSGKAGRILHRFAPVYWGYLKLRARREKKQAKHGATVPENVGRRKKHG